MSLIIPADTTATPHQAHQTNTPGSTDTLDCDTISDDEKYSILLIELRDVSGRSDGRRLT
jgi:hypothetical protein